MSLMADINTRFEIVNGRQVALLVVPLLGFVLSSLAVAARWYSRSVRRVNTLTEDALCLAALAMSSLVVAMVYILVFLSGEGLSSEQIKADATRDFDIVNRHWLRVQLALNICWATSVATVQLAFLKFFARFYEGKTLARNGCYATMVLIAIWYIWSLAKWASVCHPPGKCVRVSKKACVIIDSLHVFFNVVILITPLPVIHATKIYKTHKATTVVFFLLASFTVLAVLRMDCAFDIFGNATHDPISASWWRACFSPAEIAVGIICCCVPNCSHDSPWPRERPPLPTEGTGLRRLKFRTTSSSSSTSNLNPAHWMPGPKAQVNAFVTLENGLKSSEQVEKLGHNEIKVTKDYQLERGRM